MDAMTYDAHKLQSLVTRALGDLSSANGGVMVSLGHKLGLYKAMRNMGPMSSHEVAARARCAERYVREWLASQAAGGYLAYHATSDTYELTPEQAMVLADEDSPYFMPNAWEVTASLWSGEARALRAFRSGEGVSWGEHDGRLFCGVAAFYRNGYRAHLVQDWLPKLDGVVEKLAAGAKVADVGCGFGDTTILMAQAFPKSRFWGFDAHAPSIDAAREAALAAGVAERVTFEIGDARGYDDREYDLVCFFDCLHDMGDPVGAARHAESTLARDGTVMLVEPFAGDRTEDNLNAIGRLYYAGSTMLCCAHAISEGGQMVLGAQAGEARLAQVFEQAGFRSFRRAAETPFNLILEAKL